MIVVVAGGIGSGKSTVMKAFEALGAKTLYADRLNKELLQNEEYISVIDKNFQGVVSDRKINVNRLRDIIFNSETERKKLNDIAHPRIFKMIENRAASEGLIFVEIPLLEECEGLLKYDKLCAVKAPFEDRVERIIKRDGVSREIAVKIIEAQRKEEKVYEKADFIVENQGLISDIEENVRKIYEQCLIG